MAEGGKTCEICCENYNEKDFHGISECSHRFCLNCMTDYITFNITNGKVNKIKCADSSCPAEYNREDIRKFGSQEIFQKYLKFKENIDVSTNPNLKWCIRPDCNRFLKKGKNNRANCECGYEMCFKCGQVWHNGKCDANIDNEFYAWAANNGNVGNCPKCKARIEKISGCNHMCCRSCDHEWCWLCGKKYSDNHYDSMNFFGCPGQHYDELSRCHVFLINLAILIFLPVILALAPPVALVRVYIETFDDEGCIYNEDDGCCYNDNDEPCENCGLKYTAGIMCIPIVFVIGFIGSIFVLPLLLVPAMIYQIYRLFKLIFYRCSCCLK